MADLSHDWRQVRLPNGLRLITIARPGRPTVAVRAYIRAGSRYDHEASPHAQVGQAHLLEHLLFKGTATRSQRQIFAAIEGLGGALQAGTAKEYVDVSAITLPGDLPVALDIVAEVLAAPLLGEDDFWNEKLVVLQEIRRARDRQSILFDFFTETLWETHPLRYPTLGDLEGLQALDHASLRAFYRQRYVAGNMLLVICGDVDHDRAQGSGGHRLRGAYSRPRAVAGACAGTAATWDTDRPPVEGHASDSSPGRRAHGHYETPGSQRAQGHRAHPGHGRQRPALPATARGAATRVQRRYGDGQL